MTHCQTQKDFWRQNRKPKVAGLPPKSLLLRRKGFDLSELVHVKMEFEGDHRRWEDAEMELVANKNLEIDEQLKASNSLFL